MILLEQRGKVTQSLNSAEDVDNLGSLVEEIRGSMMDYQVRAQSAHFRLS